MSKEHVDVVVTGHTGFIGQSVVRELDRNNISWMGASKSTGVDLTQQGSLNNYPAADWIIHLAGTADVIPSWENPTPFFRTNYTVTLEAIEYARRTNANFLYMSSYMYGNPKSLPIGENHPLAYRNPYAWSKRMGEMLCEAYTDCFSTNATILRLFNVYGAEQAKQQLIPQIVSQAKAGDLITVSDLKPRRDWLWIEDLADAVVRAISSTPKKLEIYNIGYGKSYSVQEIISKVMDQMGPRKVVTRDEIRKNEILDCVCDNTKFRNKFDWKPRLNIEQGLAKVIDHYS